MTHAGNKLKDCCGRASIDCTCNEPEEIARMTEEDFMDEPEDEEEVCGICGQRPDQCENYLLHQMKLTEAK